MNHRDTFTVICFLIWISLTLYARLWFLLGEPGLCFINRISRTEQNYWSIYRHFRNPSLTDKTEIEDMTANRQREKNKERRKAGKRKEGVAESKKVSRSYGSARDTYLIVLHGEGGRAKKNKPTYRTYHDT